MKKIIEYGNADITESRTIAEMADAASSGIVEYMFHDLVPGKTPVDLINQSLESPDDTFSYKNANVAKYKNKVIGMIFSYSSEFQDLTDEMREFFPEDRLNHLKDIYISSVENSLYVDALYIEESYRGQGIGQELMNMASKKALKLDFTSLSLIVLAYNKRALKFYDTYGFYKVNDVVLLPHELIPHEGGAFLMKYDIKKEDML